MKYDLHKKFVGKTLKQEIIGPWYKPKGFDLTFCQLASPMFGFVLNLVYGTYDEWEKFMVKYHDRSKDNADSLAVYCWATDPKTQENVKYLLITQNTWSAKDYGTICHELHHFTHLALDTIGIEYGRAGEELFAYFQGHFMELVVRAFIELNSKKTIHERNPRHSK